ncbi:MAG TPA: GNAT family N-acetyltransferase [Gemmatimonadales bacterium]
MEIRLAEPSEAGAAVAILNACGVEMLDRHGVPDWLLPSIPGTIAADAAAARLFVVTEDREIIGTFALCDIPDDYFAPIQWEEPEGPAVYLHRFAISQNLQSKGIGAWCLSQMEALVRRRGRRWIRLDATLVDPRVRAFYAKAGFRERGVTHIPVPLPQHPAIAVMCYEKRLDRLPQAAAG